MSERKFPINGVDLSNDDLDPKTDYKILDESSQCKAAWSVVLGQVQEKTLRSQPPLTKKECAIVLVKAGISKPIADHLKKVYTINDQEVLAHSGVILQ